MLIFFIVTFHLWFWITFKVYLKNIGIEFLKMLNIKFSEEFTSVLQKHEGLLND